MAANPEPYQILGLKLKPFCLGHCEHMERHGVVFASGETADATLPDLLLGVFICSQSYEQFSRFIERPKWADEIKRWGAKCGEFDAAAKLKLFSDYMRNGSQQPVVIFEQDGKTSGAHWIQCVKISLMQAGYSETRAMNMPLSQALADFFKIAENNGVLRIASPLEAEAIRALEQEAECPPS